MNNADSSEPYYTCISQGRTGLRCIYYVNNTDSSEPTIPAYLQGDGLAEAGLYLVGTGDGLPHLWLTRADICQQNPETEYF